MAIGDIIHDFFAPYGDGGILLFVAVVFFIDAIVFPMLPEVFFTIGVMAHRPASLSFGIEVLGAAVIGELIGVLILYFIVKKIKIPGRLKKFVDKYIKFLVVSDERILLVNRVAPVIPFTGAFLALVDGWKFSKAMIYIIVGCVLKYGVIMLLLIFLENNFGEAASKYSIYLIIAVLAISLTASYLRKKKIEKEMSYENS